jgi:hypothetical protein
MVPKARLVGLNVTVPDDVPVPLSVTDCGLLLAFVTIVSVPLCAPVAVGAKATSMVQLVPAANDPDVLHVPPLTTL